MIARVASALRCAGSPCTTIAECRRVTATTLADLYEVRCRPQTFHFPCECVGVCPQAPYRLNIADVTRKKTPKRGNLNLSTLFSSEL